MKTIDEYMEAAYRMEIIEDQEEGGFVASYPELKGCITCGSTIKDAIDQVIDAKKEWFIAAMEEGIEIPEPMKEYDYSGQFKFRMPKSLHRQLAEHAKQEGISMNQYCIYLLTREDERFMQKVHDEKAVI